ncbi:alpha/beta hydrolase [Ensifer sp. ENS04]|uniref:alpha/beta hydrolase n=1 Tax=unclassified Ensifer TaxID=2633371 RepID=UPI0008E434CD|nr:MULTISPECIES: alpha/beta hydrolase [unclassified Ensifer]MBD9544850.1 alpha/beta hydrolase [Ensifer sp. ENS04]SFH31124.1 acetyl esterase [Ensifer sp. OV372]
MPVDANIATFLAGLPATQPGTLDEMRAETDRALIAMQGPSEPVSQIEDLVVAGDDPDVSIPVRAYWPAGAKWGGKPPAMVFAHAGGWCLVSLDAYDNPCRALANATGCVVFSVGYRLAPEHPYPAALDDVYRALCFVADHSERLGVDRNRIVIAGDSAGGNLAAATAMLARDRSGPPIAQQLLMYPPVDTDLETASYQEFADGYYLTRDAMKFCWGAYLGDRVTTPPVYAAPLRGDLSSLPPATIMVSEYDPLRNEGESYARKLDACGVPTTLIVLEGMVHACIHMLGITPAAKAIFANAGRELRLKLGAF